MKQIINLTSNGTIDHTIWKIFELPLNETETWKFEEPDVAIQAMEADTLAIKVDQYTRKGLPQVQITDNGKHFYMTDQIFDLPQSGVVTISADMWAQPLHHSGEDYHKAFTIFIVNDVEQFLIYDVLTSGTKHYALHEKLEIPGLISSEEAFTYVIEAPFKANNNPQTWNNYTITFDYDQHQIIWRVNGQRIYHIDNASGMPKKIKLGLGLFAIEPYINGVSNSIHHQGMEGRWRNISISHQQ